MTARAAEQQLGATQQEVETAQWEIAGKNNPAVPRITTSKGPSVLGRRTGGTDTPKRGSKSDMLIAIMRGMGSKAGKVGNWGERGSGKQ